MKRISVKGPVAVNLVSGRHLFLPGKDYEVTDEVARFPWLQQYLLKVEDASSEDEKPKRARRRAAKAAEESDDGKQAASA